MTARSARIAASRRRGTWAGSLRRLAWVLAVLLPALVFTGLLIYRLDTQASRAVEDGLRLSARASIQAVDRILSNEFSTLEALAAAPTLELGQIDLFATLATRVFQNRTRWIALDLINAADDSPILRLTADGFDQVPMPVSPAAREHLTTQGRATTDGVRVEPTVPERYVVVHAPVVRDGRTLYILSVAVRTSTISEVLRDQAIPGIWTVAVLDRGYRIAGRTRAEDEFVGTSATPSLVEEVRKAQEKFFFALNKEGQRVYTAFSTSPVTGWTAAIGAPADLVEAPRRRALYTALGGGGLALILTGLIATALARSTAARRAAEQALEVERAAERRLSDIAAKFPGVIYRRVLHPDGRISYTYTSPGAERFLGLAEPLAPGTLDTQVAKIVHPDDVDRWREAIRRSAATLEPYEIEGRITRSDGSVRWVHSAANTYRRDDGTVVWDGVLLDVTDLKRATALRRESEARLRAVVEAAADGIVTIDERGIIEAVNPAAERLFGYTAEEMVGRDIQILMPDRWREGYGTRLQHYVTGGEPRVVGRSVEVEGLRKDGTVFPMELSVGEAHVDGRRIFAGVVRDITERKRAESTLREALASKDDLLRQRETLLREVHHRVKNNLQVVTSLLVLEAGRIKDPQARERLTLVRHRVHAMARLHEQLYEADNLSRIELARYLRDLCRELGNLFSADRVEVEVDAEPLHCDLELAIPLGLIASELVTNSFKHAFPDSRPGRIRVTLRRDGTGGVDLVVADNGVGRPAADDGARQGFGNGMGGLGTILVDALVRQIKASVATDMDGGEGTSVTVRVPPSEQLEWVN